jgi:hypothetical protein
MKLKATFAAVTILMSAAALPAVAATDHPEFFGSSAPSTAAMHQIPIDPKTKYVNVTGGDVVQFNVGGKSFTWDFDVANNVSSFDLNQVAPNGMLDHPVTVYVAPDPNWIGG